MGRIRVRSVPLSIVAAVTLVVIGVALWSQAYGYADRDLERSMELESVFQVGSIAKSVTAWGVTLLAERGLVELDTPVGEHIHSWDFPDGETSPDAVTVRSLLSNTAGMPIGSFGNEFDPRNDTVPSLRDSLSREAYLVREPGAGFSCSDVTGSEFAAFMQEEVLEPTGMVNASFAWNGEIERKVARGYDLSGTTIEPYVYPEKASGGLFADVNGIARFVAAGMKGTPHNRPAVISRESIGRLYTPEARIGGVFGLVSDWYGLGHFLEEWSGWSGVGSVKFSRISVGIALLWVFTAMATLVWASAQPYLMVTSVFPGVTSWAATALAALAVVLFAAALVPRVSDTVGTKGGTGSPAG